MPRQLSNSKSPPSDRVDLRGFSSGWALLKLGHLSRSLSPGVRLEVLGSDAQMARDLPMVAVGLGLRLLDQSGGHGDYHFSLVKQPAHQPEPSPGLGLAGPTTHPSPQRGIMSRLLDQAPHSSLVVDARGSDHPGPLLGARKAIGAVKVGEVLEVVAKDPGAQGDISAWATAVGHVYLGHVLGDGCQRVFVRRGK